MLEVHYGVEGETPPVPLSEEARQNLIGDSKYLNKVSYIRWICKNIFLGLFANWRGK